MEDAILVDAGTGNLHSVFNALKALGYSIRVTSDPEDLARPNRVILPGVGAFGRFMEGLTARRLVEPIQKSVKRGDPLLAICVGMQALFEYSEELGRHAGLSILEGCVIRFPETAGLKVPLTGWNQLWPVKPHPILKNITPGAYAYFNHSYYCVPENMEDTVARTDYGFSFTSAAQRGAVIAVQFHPEKSQKVGLQILKNFMEMTDD